MAAVADKNFVEGEESLTVVEAGLGQDALFDDYALGRGGFEGLCNSFDAESDEHTGIFAGGRIDANHDLAIKVFGDVGDQPVLAQGHNNIVGPKDEAVDLRAQKHRLPPVRRNGGAGFSQRLVKGAMRRHDALDRDPLALQYETRRGKARIGGAHTIEVGFAPHDDDPGRQQCHVRLPFACAAGLNRRRSPTRPAPGRRQPD